MKINKSTLRKMIRSAILEQTNISMEKRLRTSYNKELTPMEECKFLLGVYTNITRFLDDVDSVIRVLSAVLVDNKKLDSNKSASDADQNKLLDFKNDLKIYKEILETGHVNDPDFTKMVEILISVINKNDLSLLDTATSAGIKAEHTNSFKTAVYEIIDMVHYFFELGTLTGYELTIEEYISLGEEAAKRGYTSSAYSGNESNILSSDIDF